MKNSIVTFCIIGLVCPLSFAGKKQQVESKVLPEVRPDKALVFLCPSGFRPKLSFPTLVDNRPFGSRIGKQTCTYDYLDPGQHDMWYFGSQMVNPYAVSVLRWDFEQGRTYYVLFKCPTRSCASSSTGATDPHYELLDADAGKKLVDAALGLSTETTPKEEGFLKWALKKTKRHDLDTANNALIASRTFDQAIAATDTAGASDNEDAPRFHEEAAVHFAEAADRFDELKRRAKKAKKLAFWGTIIGPALAEVSVRAQIRAAPTGSPGFGLATYSVFYGTRSLEELIAAYEGSEAEARARQAEARRRLACYAASKDDAVIGRCIGGG